MAKPTWLASIAGTFVWLVLSNAATLVVIGVLLGALASWMANKAIAALLYRPRSFGVFPAVAIVFLLVVAVVASWLPVRRATAVDPLHALRLEEGPVTPPTGNGRVVAVWRIGKHCATSKDLGGAS